MTHARIAWSSLAQSRRAVLGVVLLGLLALGGVFADVLASPAPIVAVGPGGLTLLPGVVHAAAYEGKHRLEVERIHAGDAVFWPLCRYGPTTPGDVGANAPRGAAHPLGTDAEGRDLFARLLWGARTALGLALGALLLSAALGVALGGLAGYERGFWSDRLARLVETIDTFPTIIVVALARAVEREPSVRTLVIAVALVRWAEVARLVRAEVLRAGVEDYVVSARALGASPLRVLARHIAPNAIGPAVVSSVFGVASVVLLEAAISFLQMGGSSRATSWGETLAEGARDPGRLRLIALPALLLAATVGGAYMLATALRDATNPRVAHRR